jgi:hypothetical protein
MALVVEAPPLPPTLELAIAEPPVTPDVARI